jgi:hypothetical protein
MISSTDLMSELWILNLDLNLNLNLNLNLIECFASKSNPIPKLQPMQTLQIARPLRPK